MHNVYDWTHLSETVYSLEQNNVTTMPLFFKLHAPLLYRCRWDCVFCMCFKFIVMSWQNLFTLETPTIRHLYFKFHFYRTSIWWHVSCVVSLSTSNLGDLFAHSFVLYLLAFSLTKSLLECCFSFRLDSKKSECQNVKNTLHHFLTIHVNM